MMRKNEVGNVTVNSFCVTPAFAVCVADRRLTYAHGAMASDRAKKISIIQCQDARLVAAFNGFAGQSMGDSPLDWLLRENDLGSLRLLDLVERIKSILEAKLNRISGGLARLSLTSTGFWLGQPILVHISNYEFLKSGKVLNVAQSTMTIEVITKLFIFTLTGSYNRQNRVALINQFKGYSERGVTPERVRKTLLKAVRDVPFSGDRDGVVGSNCHSVILYPTGRTIGKLHTLGGSTVSEFPDFIGPESSFSDIMVDTNPSEDGPAWGHPETRRSAKLRDRRCRICKNPIPPGQRQCGVCDDISEPDPRI